MKQVAFLLAAILIEIMATTSLRASAGFTRLGPTVFSLVAYGIAFYCLSVALQTIPVGIAYAIWSGIGTAGIVTVAWKLYGEALEIRQIIGIVIILVGVIIVQWGRPS